MSAFRVYTSSLVLYQDLITEGLTMIVESGHINCAMSHPEVRELRLIIGTFRAQPDQELIQEKHRFYHIRY